MKKNAYKPNVQAKSEEQLEVSRVLRRIRDLVREKNKLRPGAYGGWNNERTLSFVNMPFENTYDEAIYNACLAKGWKMIDVDRRSSLQNCYDGSSSASFEYVGE